MPFPARSSNRSGSATRSFYTWQEAVEQAIDLGESSLPALAAEPVRREFVLEPVRERRRSAIRRECSSGPWFASADTILGGVELSASEVAPAGLSDVSEDREPDARARRHGRQPR